MSKSLPWFSLYLSLTVKQDVNHCKYIVKIFIVNFETAEYWGFILLFDIAQFINQRTYPVFFLRNRINYTLLVIRTVMRTFIEIPRLVVVPCTNCPCLEPLCLICISVCLISDVLEL